MRPPVNSSLPHSGQLTELGLLPTNGLSKKEDLALEIEDMFLDKINEI